MLMLLSPAKSLDFATPPQTKKYTQPQALEQSERLIALLRNYSPAEVASLMGISDPLAVLNVQRYADWQLPFSPANAKQAVLAFDGDVYDGLGAKDFKAADLDFAQEHLGILSGLYGLLRPLDLIQPYRLEMGTRLVNPRGKDLYAFWGNRLRDAIQQRLDAMESPVLLNLASEEYFKAVRAKDLRARVIQPVFEDWKNGRYKIISFFAKKARGGMARAVICGRIRAPEPLRALELDGYTLAPEVSDDQRWVFRRRIE